MDQQWEPNYNVIFTCLGGDMFPGAEIRCEKGRAFSPTLTVGNEFKRLRFKPSIQNRTGGTIALGDDALRIRCRPFGAWLVFTLLDRGLTTPG